MLSHGKCAERFDALSFGGACATADSAMAGRSRFRARVSEDFLLMFVDHIRIYARAGTGGDGSASFRREKFIPRGGPDGGDGGRGGSIILKVDSHTDNLKTFFFDASLKAGHGGKGAGRLKAGRSGEDKIFRVPAGTLVFREKGEASEGGGDSDDFL